MQAYKRPDGAEMVEFAPGQWVNRKAGEALGLIERPQADAPVAAEIAPVGEAPKPMRKPRAKQKAA